MLFSHLLPLQWLKWASSLSTRYSKIFWCGFVWAVLEKGACVWLPWGSVSRWRSLVNPQSKALVSSYVFLYTIHIILLARQNQCLLFQGKHLTQSNQFQQLLFPYGPGGSGFQLVHHCLLPNGKGAFHGNQLLDSKSLRNSFTGAKSIAESLVPTTPKLKDFGYWFPFFFISTDGIFTWTGCRCHSSVTTLIHSRNSSSGNLFHETFKHRLQFHRNPRTAASDERVILSTDNTSEVSWNSSDRTRFCFCHSLFIAI